MPVLIPGLLDDEAGGVFPDQQLEHTAEAAFGADLTTAPSTWAWTGLTCEHPSIGGHIISRLTGDPITIKQGVTVGAGQASTTTATLRLFNHDGALTPLLPSSPHYPYVDAGTPIRLRQRHDTTVFTDTFNRTVSGGWGVNAGVAWNNAGTAVNWSVNGTAGLCAMTTANGFYTNRNMTKAVNSDIVFDIQTPQTATGGGLFGGPRFRVQADNQSYYWLACEFMTTGGIRLILYRFLTGQASANLQQTIVAGLTYTPGQPVRGHLRVEGGHIRARAWLPAGVEPSTWAIDRTDHAIARAGYLGWVWWRAAANTNTSLSLQADNITHTHLPYDLLEGYIADVRPTFNPGANGLTWSTVQIDVGGIGSLSEKLDAPAWSPMRRSIQTATETPLAYWPLEDTEGATFGVSAFPGGTPMQVTGPAVFAFSGGTPADVFQSRTGSRPMVSLAAGARLSGIVPLSAVQTEWAVSFIAEFYAPGITPVTDLRVAQWDCQSGTFKRWAFIALAAGGYVVRAYSIDGTSVDVVTFPAVTYFGLNLTITVEAQQSGGNVSAEFFIDDFSMASGSTPGTLGAVNRVTLNPDRTNTTGSTNPYGIRFVAGHVRVVDETNVIDTPYYTPPELPSRVSADYAWYLEPAHRRIKRLCDEERVPIALMGNQGADGMTQLNAQQDGSFTALVVAAAEAESGGLLYEAGFGYAYLPRAQRYNRPVALTIDLTSYKRSRDTGQEDILVPELDSRAANYWTVERTLGAEGSFAAPAGFRARRGTIGEKITLDVLRDEDTVQHAAWRVNRAYNARDAHYPSMPIDLAANPDLIGDWLAVTIGSRIARTGQPSIAGLGVIDQTVDQITTTVSPTTWQVQVQASPAKVWDVAIAGDASLGKADTDSSTFRAATSTATTLLIDVLAGPRWTTDPAEMPIYVTLATGEQVRIDAITGTSNPQTATVVRGMNGIQKTVPASTGFWLTSPARAAL